VRPVFYRIDENLAPQIQHIETLINPRTKAILVAHFFGFPAPLDALKSLCRAHGIRLIEDCAHSLFGQGPLGPLGSSGDAAIFSPRKFLPIPDGGIAVLNSSSIEFPDQSVPPTELLTAARVLRLWHKALKVNAPLGRRLMQRLLFVTAWPLMWSTSGLVKSVARVTRQWDADVRSFDPSYRALLQGMSYYSRNFMEQLDDPYAIVRARRHNYEKLLAAAQITAGVEPLFSSLPAGVNPLCFPVRCRAPRQAADVLSRWGIEASDWWRHRDSQLNWDDFPIESELKSSVLVFPIHQSLTRKAVFHITMRIRDLGL
jgi:dTDP-4-amino-4,6-dideoxygalactose transaminase